MWGGKNKKEDLKGRGDQVRGTGTIEPRGDSGRNSIGGLYGPDPEVPYIISAYIPLARAQSQGHLQWQGVWTCG